MFSRCPIRTKLLLGGVLLCLIVTGLSFAAFQGVYSFRSLTKSVRARTDELPLTAQLMQNVCDLRVIVSKLQRPNEIKSAVGSMSDPIMLREEFHTKFNALEESLGRYKEQLDLEKPQFSRIADIQQERETVGEIEQLLERIKIHVQAPDWVLQDLAITMDGELAELQQQTSELPTIMMQRTHDSANEARVHYHRWMVLCWVTSGSAAVLLGLAAFFFHGWIFRPLSHLIEGSRRVAGGDFSHRIHLNTEDEVAELAEAMNNMTTRFQEIRDDLDHRVKQRTRQVIRSEQLASVGLLAAGVAHEINNPMASIAMAAEGLEARLHDIIVADDELPDEEHNEEITIARKYLKRIQDEAFRCKGITERLLDYSRMGDVERQRTELGQLVEDVIEMVRHLGKYRDKHITFDRSGSIYASVNPQELKQVVLNLITNGLDSLDPGGTVTASIKKKDGRAELVFEDDGCGMTREVLDNLFEPFFTRRRDGQGTGLGLAITYRIVDEHGGTISAASDGPGKGSIFRIKLPLVQNEKELNKGKKLQAA